MLYLYLYYYFTMIYGMGFLGCKIQDMVLDIYCVYYSWSLLYPPPHEKYRGFWRSGFPMTNYKLSDIGKVFLIFQGL